MEFGIGEPTPEAVRDWLNDHAEEIDRKIRLSQFENKLARAGIGAFFEYELIPPTDIAENIPIPCIDYFPDNPVTNPGLAIRQRWERRNVRKVPINELRDKH